MSDITGSSSSSDEHYTALTLAAAVGDPESVRQLLKSGADPNQRNDDGSTALTFTRKASIARLLVEAGARVSLEAPEGGDTSLHHACGFGPVRLVRVLLEASDTAALNDRFDDCCYTPLTWAAVKGRLDVMKLLIGKGADVNARDIDRDGWTALELALEEGQFDSARLLLTHGADALLIQCPATRDLLRTMPLKE